MCPPPKVAKMRIIGTFCVESFAREAPGQVLGPFFVQNNLIFLWLQTYTSIFCTPTDFSNIGQKLGFWALKPIFGGVIQKNLHYHAGTPKRQHVALARDMGTTF